jgi:hypothetical protein
MTTEAAQATEPQATETQAPPPAAKPVYAEVVLPSGKRAVLPREPMGHDMERAYEIAPNTANLISLSMALFAQVGELDGKRVAYEELRHGLNALDAFRLSTWTNNGFEVFEIAPKKGQEPPPSPL